MTHRIEKGIERGEPVAITINGQPWQAFEGETVATALLAAGITVFHRSRQGHLRGPYCNMGTCFECLVGVVAPGEAPRNSWVRACMTIVEEGMTIVTGAGFAERSLRALEGDR